MLLILGVRNSRGKKHLNLAIEQGAHFHNLTDPKAWIDVHYTYCFFKGRKFILCGVGRKFDISKLSLIIFCTSEIIQTSDFGICGCVLFIQKSFFYSINCCEMRWHYRCMIYNDFLRCIIIEIQWNNVFLN